MWKYIVVSIMIFLGIFITNATLARVPTKQPPISMYGGGRVELSADFIEYLIEVKDFRHVNEIFRTVQYNFSEIQGYARDFLREGPQKTQLVMRKKREALEKKWAFEREREENQEKEYVLGITGQNFLDLFDTVERDPFSSLGKQQERYLNFLKTRMIKNAEIYKIAKSTFCYNPSFFQTGRERAVATVKNRLKKYGFLKKKEFLNSSAAPVIQQILIKEFPCT